MEHIVPSLLSYRRLPARLDMQQVACLLGFKPHDIPILVAAKLLKPLGCPAKNGPKFFAAVEVEDFAKDRDWLDKANKAVNKHWAEKNLSRTKLAAAA